MSQHVENDSAASVKHHPRNFLKRLGAKLWSSRPRVAVIRLRGIIGDRSGSFRHALSLTTLNPLLEQAFATRSLAALAIEINSPGGSPVQGAMISDRIRFLAEKRGVPVLAFVEDIAASGGYWLACAADEIYANTMSLIGSIGVISAGFGCHELLQRYGITRRLYTAGDRKSLLDPFQPETQEDVSRLRNLQTEIHQDFQNMVRRQRGSRLNGDEQLLFSGEIWTGRQAVELGLIDGIDDIHHRLQERFGSKVKLRRFGYERSWFHRFGLGQENSTALVTVDALAATLEEHLWRARYGL